MATLDYGKLKCPRCGNRARFREFALQPTVQDFTVPSPGNAPVREERKDSNGMSISQEITCCECRERGVVVWSNTDGYSLDFER